MLRVKKISSQKQKICLHVNDCLNTQRTISLHFQCMDEFLVFLIEGAIAHQNGINISQSVCGLFYFLTFGGNNYLAVSTYCLCNLDTRIDQEVSYCKRGVACRREEINTNMLIVNLTSKLAEQKQMNNKHVMRICLTRKAFPFLKIKLETIERFNYKISSRKKKIIDNWLTKKEWLDWTGLEKL